ncbi:MAG: apolipoprotein N-acyltransferase [Candidatus Poribacteria bacterium]|nr:apolipoprotein N-acyltransferase [Candidatus Poribacteria bacterium]
MTDKIPKRWRPYALLAGFALLYTAIHPNWFTAIHSNWSLCWAGWFAAVPLLLALRRAETWRRGFWYGWLGGFVAFLGVVGWLYKVGMYSAVGPRFGWIVGAFGAALLAAYLGLYVGLFGVLLVKAAPRSRYLYPPAAACFWALCEWLRSWMLTGFPWATLGASQWNCLPVAQLASLGGEPLISFVLMYVNAAVALIVMERPKWTRGLAWSSPALALCAFAFLYGAAALNQKQPTDNAVRFAVVPGNIPQDERWRRNALKENFEHYMERMEKAAQLKPDAVVLPETSVLLPALDDAQRERFEQFPKTHGVDLLYGAPRRDPDTLSYFNSAVAVDHEEGPRQFYNKQHLVPFGEYIPLRSLLPGFIVEKVIGIGDYAFGEQANLLEIAGTKAGVPICFESVFSEISREFVRNGADLLIVLTNDGWYDGTPAIPQHNVCSVFRAIETRRWLVRAANRGVTCFIDPYGRIVGDRVEASDRNGVIAAEVSTRTDQTLYVRWGNWVSFLSIFASLALIAVMIIRGRREEREKWQAKSPQN